MVAQRKSERVICGFMVLVSLLRLRTAARSILLRTHVTMSFLGAFCDKMAR